MKTPHPPQIKPINSKRRSLLANVALGSVALATVRISDALPRSGISPRRPTAAKPTRKTLP